MGERISIKNTRSCINAILDGSILKADFKKDRFFGFQIPIELNGVGREICDPRIAWANEKEYNRKAVKLVKMFRKNYEQYIDPNYTDYSKHGPHDTKNWIEATNF